MSNFKTKSMNPGQKHQELHKAMMQAFLDRPDMPPEQMLAIIAYAAGQMMALLDQRKFTVEMAIRLVQENLELGNAHMIEQVMNTQGNA